MCVLCVCVCVCVRARAYYATYNLFGLSCTCCLSLKIKSYLTISLGKITRDTLPSYSVEAWTSSVFIRLRQGNRDHELSFRDSSSDGNCAFVISAFAVQFTPVSYTHLTLPTS